MKAVALGSGWVAAVTSLNFLRVFSEGGMQVWADFDHIVVFSGDMLQRLTYILLFRIKSVILRIDIDKYVTSIGSPLNR